MRVLMKDGRSTLIEFSRECAVADYRELDRDALDGGNRRAHVPRDEPPTSKLVQARNTVDVHFIAPLTHLARRRSSGSAWRGATSVRGIPGWRRLRRMGWAVMAKLNGLTWSA